ncbi:SRPBCC family protein [Georgenia yuyongxinii]|uniref:SRPBCC family protein n=2 Tax=Georgenia yuyongxinii TaxID=2589797 RepID=A0A5B8C3E6_9MICO|nr:SRPBCC family protein [Georgenia yuyongxinii]
MAPGQMSAAPWPVRRRVGSGTYGPARTLASIRRTRASIRRRWLGPGADRAPLRFRLMRYTEEIEIALPRDEVVRLFTDLASLPKWQKGLQSVGLLSGEAFQVGARTRLVFLTGKRRMEMIETITHNALPEALHAVYDTKGVHNVCENYLTEVAPDRTRWVTPNVFEFSGPMRIIGLLFGRSFSKETREQMRRFKEFAEHGTDVRG